MFIKQFIIAIGLSSLSLSANAGNTEAGTQKKVVKKTKVKQITFEACCEEQYGDSEACHGFSHVTNKIKKIGDKRVKKECFEDEESSYIIGE